MSEFEVPVPSAMDMYDALCRRHREGRFADLIDRERAAAMAAEEQPPLAAVAAPSVRVFEEYCYQHGLNPRRTHYLHELRHLRGLRGRVALVTGPGSFPQGFIAQLSQMELGGLVQVDTSEVS